MDDNAPSICEKCEKEITKKDFEEGRIFNVKANAKTWNPGESRSVVGRVSLKFYEKYNYVCLDCYYKEEGKEFNRGKLRKFLKNLREVAQVLGVMGVSIYLLNRDETRILAVSIAVIVVVGIYMNFERSLAKERKDGDSFFLSDFEKALFWKLGKSKSEKD
jgi:hypothetical protein